MRGGLPGASFGGAGARAEGPDMERAERRARIDRWLWPVAIVAAVGMFIVLLMGATVTNTGSAAGCGRSWPLCTGPGIEMWSREMIIESSHRLVTGVEGFLVLFTGIGLIRSRWDRWEARALVAAMWVSILVQSGMGAWAVKAPQKSAVLALHFGFSMIAFAATALTVLYLVRDRHERVRAVAAIPAPRDVAVGMWVLLVALYGIAYLGAYVRHSDALLACGKEWPGCAGGWWPGFEGPVGVHFLHRVAAVLGTALMVAIFLRVRQGRAQRPDLYRVTSANLLLILSQSIVGGFVAMTTLSLVSTLLHAALMALMFVLTCIACRQVVRERPVRAAEPTGAQVAAAGAD